ncbi:hypothetical protein [Natronobeatus ordinarius]|uniref:hypothetical protein n=1 Tax=Natronobeatus ordinarius TaxID=2963433 RepID=UPI0020CF5358|nr:hypothetical protein [Natronobeatus ordinarius]
MMIGALFHSDPTRQLEEVQKVNARDRAETDVREFHETESAKRALTELGDVVRTYPDEEPRFLYFHATFGSGKTHLLKLIGLVVDGESELAPLGERLATKWPGFDSLRHAVEDSHVDRLKPVFLNLLDRDASKEPPLPFLLYEAIARELGYPTDPNWLLEWAWTVDSEYDGVWDALTEFEHDGRTFADVLEERAYLRTWLYEALPALAETTGTDLETAAGVKASIEAAEAEVDPESFGPDDLVERVETATAALNEDGTRTELLLGLDEVALFVGDSRHRYREFEETMEALQHGPNPVVVTTGQYSLPETRKNLIGESDADHWTTRQVLLEGTDTEIIVRKRWLQKRTEGSEFTESLLSSVSDLSLETYEEVTSADPDPVESYPFREYDLTLLRRVMQELITQGRQTDHEYIQGRALLVLVRSLFTKFDWARTEAGALVTWDQLFDLLVEETTYVPLWVQEMIDNTLVPTFGDEEAREVRVSKALYLLNQAPAVPATPENLGRLLVDDVEASVEEVIAETQDALETLVDKRKVLTETNDHGDEEYTLVSEDQESVLSRAQTKAEEISPHQLSAWLETRFRETDDFFRSDGTRHEIDVGDERLVPLRYEYSVLDPVNRAPTSEYDAVCVRVLADEEDVLTEGVETWQSVNEGRTGGEHVLIAIEVPGAMLDRIRNVMGMRQALDEEVESYDELERELRTDERRLEASVSGVLEGADVYTVAGREGSRPEILERVIADEVRSVFGSSRKVLSRSLVEVEDAKAMAAFFRGSGEWPLSATDAELLGVDTETAELTDDGWCRSFVEEHEPQPIDVETLLRRTETAKGAYRGTPQESIAALLITLATSNENVGLKRDVEYVTDPAAIGRAVRTKGGLTSLQVRFDVEIVDRKQVRTFIETLLEREPAGEGVDEWLADLEAWVDENRASIKRTLKEARKEFDASLETLSATLEPAFEGEGLTTSDLGGDRRLETLIEEAETFAAARELFEGGSESLWARFEEMRSTMASRYPDATITERMHATASAGTVPTVTTVESRLEDARAHRVDAVSAQYRRLTGASPSASTVGGVLEELGEWLCANESVVRGLFEDATATFEGVDLGALEALCASAFEGDAVAEADLVTSDAVGQAKTFERVRELFDDVDGESPWARLEAAAETLAAEYPESLTRESVEGTLAASRPPTRRRVEGLLEEAKDPILGGGSTLDRLTTVGRDLEGKLPNADLTREVSQALKSEELTEDRAAELLSAAETVLDRLGALEEQLDNLEDGSVVLIETSNRD